MPLHPGQTTFALLSLWDTSSNWWPPYFSKYCGALSSFELGWACSPTTHSCNCHLAWTTTGHCWKWVILMNAKKTVGRKKVLDDINNEDIDRNASVRRVWGRALKLCNLHWYLFRDLCGDFHALHIKDNCASLCVFISFLFYPADQNTMTQDMSILVEFIGHYNRKWNVGKSDNLPPDRMQQPHG